MITSEQISEYVYVSLLSLILDVNKWQKICDVIVIFNGLEDLQNVFAEFLVSVLFSIGDWSIF